MIIINDEVTSDSEVQRLEAPFSRALTTGALLDHHVLQIALKHDRLMIVFLQVNHADRRQFLRAATLCDDLWKFVGQR